MNKIILVLFCGVFALSSCKTQDLISPVASTLPTAIGTTNVPAVVVASLSKNFPTATNTTWNQTSPTSFMATFKQNNAGKVATFQNTGAFLKVGDVIDPATLPTAIIDYLKANYAGYTIVQADAKFTKDGLIVIGYETLITVGTTQYELEFDATGKFTKLETPDGHDEGAGIAQTALLPAITTYLGANYVGYVFKEAESKMSLGVVTGYKVEIVQNNVKYNILFDAVGTFVSVNTGGKGGDNHGGNEQGNGQNGNDVVIAQTDLPAIVGTYLTTNFAGYVFVGAVVEKNTAGTVLGYEVKFTLAGKSYETEFDATGKFLKLN
ncbi:hypothetical protein GCM10011514_10250 [Emticicia aquatilis]|uniref:Putative beta-lactamase-inhibitor-like PepSY-like domain-containing protein n=1 Tax=Emticicia aquatilis TaxID=1537369 RepID=A0A916YJJ4_9BACT|nr:PepSY-like domain-containing protein [Emticicia aquatilis]GGD48186.1 hypothetical protein GCM10011514_10250 [Emticicia aquatilis]